MKVERILIAVLALALMLTLGMRLGQAQVRGPENESRSTALRPETTMNDVVPIQGRLTDASGNPINGSVSIRARIYNAETAGTTLCEDTDTVTVTNGLFNMEMDSCDPDDLTGSQQLWLGIKVGSDAEMTPRQGIYGVPFAWGLRGGAIVKGATSYLFVPGNAFFKDSNTDSTRWDMWGGSARIYAGSAVMGTRSIRIPITIPAVLYGQPVRVTSITVYYRCEDGSQNYITETALYKHSDADSWVSLVIDTTDRTSNTATSYSLPTDTANYTLSSSQGILSLRLGLYFNNNTSYVQIGGVRVTLVTDY